MLVVYMAMFMNIVIAQEKEVAGGTFKGEVIDVTPQQKPIPGVRVKLVSIATGKEYTVLTDKKGAYELKGIPAGRYTISVSKKGFGKVSVTASANRRSLPLVVKFMTELR